MRNTKTQQFQYFITLLFETSRAAALHGDILCQHFGQSSARWRVLLYITKGYDTVSAIAKATSVSRQATQRIADELATEGLIAYLPHTDRRTQTVRLTSRGKAIVRQMNRSFSLYAKKLSMKTPRHTLADAIESLKTIRNIIGEDIKETADN